MTIEKQDLVNWEWEIEEPEIIVCGSKAKDAINVLERALSIKLPDEYQRYLALVSDEPVWTAEERSFFWLNTILEPLRHR